MLTGNFTAELNGCRICQLQEDGAKSREGHRVVTSRRQGKDPSKTALLIYRMAVRAAALSMLLIVVSATAALAMPAPRELVGKAPKSGHSVAHVTKLVGTGTATDAWLGLAFVAAVLVLLGALSARRHHATA